VEQSSVLSSSLLCYAAAQQGKEEDAEVAPLTADVSSRCVEWPECPKTRTRTAEQEN